MKLVIQIPCYNEEATLPQTVRDLPRSIADSGTTHFRLIRWTFIPLCVLILLPFSAGLGECNIEAVAGVERISGEISTSSTSSSLTSRAYLPLVLTSDDFEQAQAIWSHTNIPASYEVVLFRRAFALPESAHETTLSIFADTRYEIWLDGVWLGRGPARFSQTHREYDEYHIGKLAAGDHLIAVLVQWAPNRRRSESLTPYLRAYLQATNDQGRTISIVKTDPTWKAILSDAWRQDAVPVHSWLLIGPTELLDLRRLPADWMAPDYPDSGWPLASVKDDSGILYIPRSIPPLDNVPFFPVMIDAGILSPDRKIGEVPSGTSSFDFEVVTPFQFSVEMLAEPDAPPTRTVQVDGIPLLWMPAASGRPDVLVASYDLAPGSHSLSFLNVPSTGATFSAPLSGVKYVTLPFRWGPHAGRRSLLAEPVSRPGAVVTTTSETGMGLLFAQTPAYVVLDLGRVVHGRLVAEVSGLVGTVLDVGWDERLWMGKRPLPYPGSLYRQWNQVDSWVLDGTPRTISTLDARAGRYVWIAVWGETPVSIRNLHVLEERYPVTQRGTFISSDPLLNRIWQIGVDTLYPNMTDAYTDTPWRERGQWWGDAYVEFHVNRVAFGDTALIRRGLILMAEAFKEGKPDALAPNGEGVLLLDYGMLWVQSLRDYWQLTGDLDTILQVYTRLYELMEYLRGYACPDTGLLDIPMMHWSQAALVDWPASHSRYGQSAAMNALYYKTLKDAAVLAEAIGDATAAAAYYQRAARVGEELNELLYLEQQNRYASSLMNGMLIPPTPHAQAWPLVCGAVPGDRIQAVADSLLRFISPNPDQPNVGIYGMYWVLGAMGEAERIPEAISLIQQYYGRLTDLGATTWWEGANAHLQYASSLSHGWGGAPTWFLTTYVLGARQVGPDQWEVRPALVRLESVSGTMPLADSSISVSWARPDCEHAYLRVTSPANSTGEIIIPHVGPTAVITMNQVLIWEHRTPRAENVFQDSDGVHIVSLSEGLYEVETHQPCYSTYLPRYVNSR